MVTAHRRAQHALHSPLGMVCASLSLCLVIVACGGGNATPKPHQPSPTPAATAPAEPTLAAAPTQSSISVSPPAAGSPGGADAVAEEGLALSIMQPVSGSTWSLPGDISYILTNGAPIPHGLALRVSLANVSDAVRVDLALQAATGTLTMPADKRFTGRRDLRFELVGPDGEPLPGAAVIVRDVTILGPR